MKTTIRKLLSFTLALVLALAGTSFRHASPVRAAGTIYFVGNTCVLPVCGGTSWSDAFPTLQDALSTAVSGDQIWVKAGTYYPDEGTGQVGNNRNSTFTLKNGVEIYGGFAGTETQLNQRNISLNTAILSGDIDKNDVVSANGYTLLGNNAFHVVTGSGKNSAAVLDGFTIQQGAANGTTGLVSMGGGIINEAGTPTYKNLTIYSNAASLSGGGMYNRSASPTLIAVTFYKNGSADDGGGMYNDLTSAPTLTNVVFDSNTAQDCGGAMVNSINSSPSITGGSMQDNKAGLSTAAGNGGAIYNTTGSSPTLKDIAISSNTADNGAGMYNLSSNPTLSGTTFFTGNVAQDSGGGIYNSNHSNPVLTDIQISGNISNGSGGAGMYNQLQSAPTLNSVSFEFNHAVNGRGGGMMNDDSLVTLNQVEFSTNTADLDGGGMYNFNGGSVAYNGGTIYGNIALGSGGGMYNNAVHPTINNVTIMANVASADGGGMLNLNSNPKLTGVDFTSNSSTFKGGGMVNFISNPILTNVHFLGNSAFWGGGIFNDASNPMVTDALFLANVAGNQGGGMSNEGSAPILKNVTFNSNEAATGAGMYNLGSPTLTNVTFIENNASASGGAMANNFQSAPVLKNVTISGNTAADGGGLYNDNSSTPKLINTVIANSTGGGDCVNTNGSLLDAASSNNLIEDTADDCFLVNAVNGNIVGQDPKLGSLQDNGGFAETMALLTGSPLIDKGTNAGCTATDQRGFTRPLNGDGAGAATCDIGAVEAIGRLVIRSSAVQDGWTLESSESSGQGGSIDADATTFRLGDNAQDRQFRSILSFNTAGLPDNAIVTQMTLKFKLQGTTGGNPFSSHGNLVADIRKGDFGNNNTLELGDFQATASRNAIGAIPPAVTWLSKTFTKIAFPHVNLTGFTQFRLRFQADDNDNGVADFLSFFSGDAPLASRPQLIIEYRLP